MSSQIELVSPCKSCITAPATGCSASGARLPGCSPPEISSPTRPLLASRGWSQTPGRIGPHALMCPQVQQQLCPVPACHCKTALFCACTLVINRQCCNEMCSSLLKQDLMEGIDHVDMPSQASVLTPCVVITYIIPHTWS